MPLYERYELLELRRDDGIQTFHARDITTARPVQVHMFPEGDSPDKQKLLARLDHLPDSERRRVIERGDHKGRTYVVTDRLAGYPGFREWLNIKTDLASRHTELDEQFHQLFFDPNAETAALTAPSVSPLAAPIAHMERVSQTHDADDEAKHDKRARPVGPVVGKSLLAIFLGILAAIVLLALLVAGFAFLPR
jgi:hypothetical protein